MLKNEKLSSASKLCLAVHLIITVMLTLMAHNAAHAASDKEHLSSVLHAFRATDPSKEQNLFCRGSCHLAKASHRVNSVDIENSGASTLLDVLAQFPGILVGKDHFGRPTVGIYGLLGQHRIQILVDGLRHNDPYDGTAILNLPASIIDYVDVYYGPGGTWFGEGSLLGVIAVFTKQLPEIIQFGHFSLDQGLGGGIIAAIKQQRVKAGAYLSFSLKNPHTYNQSEEGVLTSEKPYFPLHDLASSGFVELKISNTAQAYLLARSGVMQEFFGLGPNYGFGKFEHSKFVWNSDVHLLKKRAQKNALDLFFAFGLFRGRDTISAQDNLPTRSFNRLVDRNQSLRFEIGTKFHVKPFYGHDLFFGIGGILQGAQNASHSLTKNPDEPSLFTATDFSRAPRIFGRPSALFKATTGHVYGFIQDEWQIRAPLLFTVGSRLVLPIESQQFSAELLPNIAVVLIPINKLRFTVGYHSSVRVPSLYEQSDRLPDAILYGNAIGFTPSALEFERSHTIETSAWYGDMLGDTQIKASLSMHLSKIDDAIGTSLRQVNTNQNEIHIAGIRSVNEVIFHGGHSFSLGVFYSMAFRKEFDDDGYSTCQAGFFKGFSKRRYCPFELGIPRLMIKTNISFDMASAGGINLASTFAGRTKTDDLFTEPHISFDTTYTSKPIWRYMTIFASVRSSFLGYHYRQSSADFTTRARDFAPTILALIGWRINL